MKKLYNLLCMLALTGMAYAQPTLLKDFAPGPASTFFGTESVYIYETHSYLVNKDDSSVWLTNGSTSGTQKLFTYEPSKIQSFTTPYAFCKVSDKLFYAVDVNYDTTQLWYYNTTSNTPVFVKTFKRIGSLYSNSSANFYPVVEYNGKLVFSALSYEDSHIITGKGQELWESDGTAAGTKMLSDVNFGSGSSMPTGFIKAYGSLFFIATTQIGSPTPKTQLFVTDGTALGTLPHPSNIYVGANTYYLPYQFINGYLHIVTADFITPGSDLKHMYRVMSPTATISPSFSAYKLSGFSYYNGNYYFGGIPVGNGPADPTGAELYKIDTALNTSPTPVLVKDIYINMGFYGSSPFFIGTLNNKLYFTANDATGGQIWETDGTAANTKKLTSYKAKSGFSQINNSGIISNKIYYICDDSTNGFELRMMDPFNNNTITDYHIAAGEEPYNAPAIFYQFGNVIIYSYSDLISGTELWRVGTSTSTGIKVTGKGDATPLTVYPNPVNTELGVLLEGNNPGTLVITDITGKQLYFSAITKERYIDVKDWNAGVYFLSITDSNGNHISRKIVKY